MQILLIIQSYKLLFIKTIPNSWYLKKSHTTQTLTSILKVIFEFTTIKQVCTPTYFSSYLFMPHSFHFNEAYSLLQTNHFSSLLSTMLLQSSGMLRTFTDQNMYMSNVPVKSGFEKIFSQNHSKIYHLTQFNLLSDNQLQFMI